MQVDGDDPHSGFQRLLADKGLQLQLNRLYNFD